MSPAELAAEAVLPAFARRGRRWVATVLAVAREAVLAVLAPPTDLWGDAPGDRPGRQPLAAVR